MIHSARRAIGTPLVACAACAALLASNVAQARVRVGTVEPGSSSNLGLVDLSPCGASALIQPFAPWWDMAEYELVPGGDFERAAWTLTDGARTVAGSEPYAATGTLGADSLALPAGASAQSPSICVDAAYPSVRFFISGWGAVAVSLVDEGVVIPAGVALAADAWQPTPVMLTESAVLATLTGGTARVSVSLTSLAGDPVVDDVFLDPWNRGG